MLALEEIRTRARVTREIIRTSNARQNATIESPAILDREALLRALDTVMEAVPSGMRAKMDTAVELAIMRETH